MYVCNMYDTNLLGNVLHHVAEYSKYTVLGMYVS